MGEGELEVLGDELLDVGALDVVTLLELDNAEDLQSCQHHPAGHKTIPSLRLTWIDLKRAR